MPVNAQALLVLSTDALPSQEHVIRLREAAIPRADVEAHAKEIVICGR